jgi:hypothetical protein
MALALLVIYRGAFLLSSTPSLRAFASQGDEGTRENVL